MTVNIATNIGILVSFQGSVFDLGVNREQEQICPRSGQFVGIIAHHCMHLRLTLLVHLRHPKLACLR